MADNSVEIRAVVKRHGATAAVDRLSLEIRKGEFFSILGPSGSGKTTVLRLLAGFEQPDAGEILIEGRAMEGVPPNRRPVNMVFQSYALFPHLTVAGNVAFGLEMQRLPRVEIASRVAEALEVARLTSLRERLPAQLSGGEQQRVALARALVNRPAVLLLDEPLGALDQQLRQAMQIELKTIQERVRITFVLVTHHQEEALTMSDRVAVVNQGQVLQVGPPREVYESPANLFVAQFIGVSNTLTGRVLSVENGRCTMRASELPALPAVVARAPLEAAPGSRVTLVLRPERLRLSREAQPDAVPARIAKAVYNGNETQYHLCLSDTLHWQARVSNTHAGQPRFLPGELVHVSWNPDEGALVAE